MDSKLERDIRTLVGEPNEERIAEVLKGWDDYFTAFQIGADRQRHEFDAIMSLRGDARIYGAPLLFRGFD